MIRQIDSCNINEDEEENEKNYLFEEEYAKNKLMCV